MAIDYDKIWYKVIRKELDRFVGIDVLDFYSETDMQNSIKKEYDSLYKHCQNTYMDENVKTLDRHKVAACYMLAIIQAKLFKAYPSSEKGIVIIKEQLAISVGLSILRSYLISKYDSNGEIKPREVFHTDCAVFKKGFIMPDEKDVNHGSYRNNFAMELYFTGIEGNYNILALSNTLYLLEMYNRHIWKINNSSK